MQISEKRKLEKLSGRALFAVSCCVLLTAIEAGGMIFYRVRFGVDAIDTPFFWTEVALASATGIMSLLVCLSVESRALIVNFLVFYLPRLFAPIVFMWLKDYDENRPFYLWPWIYFSFLFFFGVLIWDAIYRYYCQLERVKCAVHHFQQVLVY